MIVIPAIDIRGGRCVRLVQGDFGRETVYSDDPVHVARLWAERGARWLHVVDLDGARAGELVQAALIEQLIRAVPALAVQVGGGVRSSEAIERLLRAGARRVIIGTAAIERSEFVTEAVHAYGADRIVVAVDSRGGLVATHGWETVQPVRAVDLVRELAERGVRRVLATDVERDGTLTRPNLQLLAELADLGVVVIASGGISSRTDLEALARIRGVEAAVVGRALYEGRLHCERPEDWIVPAGAV